MEAIEKTILQMFQKENRGCNDLVNIYHPESVEKAAKEISEHFEEYDKWKLENCEPSVSNDNTWILFNDGVSIKSKRTNSELYQYWKDNVYKK